MTNDKTLSDERWFSHRDEEYCYFEPSVKNFIKRLLEKPCDCGCCIRYKILIKERAGKNLI